MATETPKFAPTPARYDTFAEVMGYVAAQADKTMARHLLQHRDRMKNSKALETLRKDIDFQAEDVSADDIIYRVGRLKSFFETQLLPQVTDAASLYDACIQFADAQATALFFVNNDLVSARIAKDYLSSMVAASRSALSARGMLSEKEGAMLQTALDYSALGITAYENLREHVHTPGLVEAAFAKAGYELHNKDGKPFLEAPGPIATAAKALYVEVLEEFGMEATPGVDPFPMMFAPIHLAYAAGAQEAVSKVLGSDAKVKKRGVTREAVAHSYNTIGAAMEALGAHEGDHAEYLLDLQSFMKARLAQVTLPPSAAAVAIEKVHPLAMLAGKAACHRSEHPVVAKATPASRWLEQASVLQSVKRADDIWAESLPRLRESLMQVDTFNGLAQALNGFTNGLAEMVLYSGHPVRLLDGARAYVAAVRKEVGAELFGTPAYSEEAVATLARIEQKCSLGIENYYAAKPMVMDYTNGAYDNFYLAAVMREAAGVGLSIERLDADDLKEAAKHAHSTHREVLRDNDICDVRFDNPYVYALKARCQHLAALRDKRDALSDHSIERVEAQAATMLTELLDAMPRKTNARGKPLQSITIDADTLFKALNRMEKEAKQLESIGRYH